MAGRVIRCRFIFSGKNDELTPDFPRAVDEGFVIVEPDEVKTKAQGSTGRKQVWTYTAVVLVAGLHYAFAGATAEGLWLQVSALLLELQALSGERRLLVLGDRRRMDPGVVRGPGDPPGSNDRVLVAPAETMLRTDEFGGRPQGAAPCLREGVAEAVVGRGGGCRDRAPEGGHGVGEEPPGG